MPGSQEYAEDARNENVLVYVNGDFVERAGASISIFDSAFTQGDGIWDSFRLHRGTLLFADLHLDRLFRGLAAVGIAPPLSREELVAVVKRLLEANGMTDGVHIRVMISRGIRRTPTQDLGALVGGASAVIVAEYKRPAVSGTDGGLRLFTSSVRYPRADMFDIRLNTHSRLPFILALQQANAAGADEALMLDADGYVSSCNSVNFFMIRDGRVLTSTSDACFNGVTRGQTIELCAQNGIPVSLERFTLWDVYTADEAFVTGTFGGITAVESVDGRSFPAARPITSQLAQLYGKLLDDQVVADLEPAL